MKRNIIEATVKVAFRPQSKPIEWIWILAVVGWSVIPYKAWTRALIGTEGFNVGDLFLVVFAIPAIVVMAKEARKDPLYLWIFIMWSSLLLSVVKNALGGEDLREMFRVCRAELFWVIVPVMRMSITSEEKGERWIRGMVVILFIAAASIALFSFYPDLVPKDDEVASDRTEFIGNFQRVFTLGMWGVFAGAIFALGRGFLRGGAAASSLFTAAVYMGGLAFTFIRTYYVSIALGLAYFMFRSWSVAKKNIIYVAIGLTLFFLVASANDTAASVLKSVQERAVGFLSVDINAVDPGDVEGLGTLLWRLSEIDVGLSQMSGFPDYALGVLGKKYELIEGYQNSIPHISYFGLFYSTGLLGLIAHGGLFVVAFRRLHRRVKQSFSSQHHWVFASSFVAYALLLFGALSASLFQLPFGTVTIALTVGFSEAYAVFLQPEVETCNEAA